MLSNTWVLAAVAAVGAAAYFYQRLSYLRLRQYAHLPQAKPHIFWGHLVAIDKFMREATTKDGLVGGTDVVFQNMMASIGNPEIMLVDVRPFNHPILFIRSHLVAEQVTKQTKLMPYSVGKSPTMEFVTPITGENSIITSSGHKWKDLRKRFNPGFAPQHILSLLPVITSKAKPFVKRLDDLAKSGETFTLEPLLTSLTFDIIGAVTMDMDFNAQLPKEQQSELVQNYQNLLATYRNDDGATPWWLNPHTRIKRNWLRKPVDNYMRKYIREKAEEIKTSDKKNRSVLALSLQDEEQVTDEMVDSTIDQLKSFMFAGHDTTSILLQWAIYEVFRHPRILKTLRAELDRVIGTDPDPQVIYNAFDTRGDEIMREMTYTSAVIKETLRLHSPAGTARFAPVGSNFHIKLVDGSSVCVDGTILFNCQDQIQMDPEIYGPTVKDFMPERWLGNVNTSAEAEDIAGEDEKAAINQANETDIPASAWRPFERGPRNCIGQELANIEGRFILACAVRRYDFTKVGRGEAKLGADGKPLIDEKGKHISDNEPFGVRQITARPNDGIEMRVKLREM
ncbi:cytochrome P450 52A11 [Plectosphaerella plurivora]|uniref:Cytochrome P450 52A11 n=1 Tax=Plectosphaerella plurivora TaxID=936078 RepID=A0A9P8VKE0_9PEZI|nr:cytochrome P450 52A11 [Plectosphaerella plurivora]